MSDQSFPLFLYSLEINMFLDTPPPSSDLTAEGPPLPLLVDTAASANSAACKDNTARSCEMTCVHRKNGGGPLGWGPLNNQPHIHLISRVYLLLPISPFKGPTGGVKQLGAPIPRVLPPLFPMIRFLTQLHAAFRLLDQGKYLDHITMSKHFSDKNYDI